MLQANTQLMSRIIFSSSLILHQLYPTSRFVLLFYSKKRHIYLFIMVVVLNIVLFILSSLDCFRRIVKMSVTETSNPGISFESMIIKPPSHPTYDLKGVIKLALAEDAGDRGFDSSLFKFSFF